MDLIDRHRKKPDEKIEDPTVRKEARRYSVRTQLAFLPDEVIGQSWYFRFLTLIHYYGFLFFHGLKIIGIEKVNPDEGCLFISRHSTHNADIQPAIVFAYNKTGKVIRSLIHRHLIPLFPILRYMGSVAGERPTAISLLKSGFWVGVIPGGAEEAMIGHENAYRVYWPKNRKGFVHAAVEAQVPIVPTFMVNQEEMRWNPVLYFWNFLRLGQVYSFILSLRLPLLTPMLHFLGPLVWFSMTWLQIPIPAQLTLYVGDPVPYDLSKDSIDDIVERCRWSLQALINSHQPQGKSYRNAIQQRIASLVK